MNGNTVVKGVFTGVDYLHHYGHRGGNRQKSRWTISKPEELDSFKLGFNENWGNEETLWSVHLDANKAISLGTSPLGIGPGGITRNLLFAKYVDKGKSRTWHGYPADHKKTQDIPDSHIIQCWITRNYIRKTKASKMIAGQL